jgi:NADP-dependent 3-hydroxy acid dehydrogenase YdfG
MSPRVVVVTGASEGIGASIAQRLGRDGFTVVLAARRERMLREVAARSGSNALVVRTDVTKRDQVQRLRDRAISEFGAVDVWINNVGRGITRPVLELTDDEFDEMMAVNVKSALYGMQAIVPHFIERGSGHVPTRSVRASRKSITRMSPLSRTRRADSLGNAHESVEQEDHYYDDENDNHQRLRSR